MTRVVSYWGSAWNFLCPGCDEGHAFLDDGRWAFSGTDECPTFSPSLVVKLGEAHLCHSFVREGYIQFLNDCTHRLAGETVPLESIEGTYLDGESY